jgi:hypothetical protein
MKTLPEYQAIIAYAVYTGPQGRRVHVITAQLREHAGQELNTR